MKCDELERFGMADPAIDNEYEMYKVKDVDEAIAELKAKLPLLRIVGKCFPSADDGYFLAWWEDGLPDIGYIGAEDDVIETIRDRGEGHSIEWWMPLPDKLEVK